MADFPGADPGAISDLASSLQAISSAMAGVGLDTEGLRGSVMGSEQWQGSASEKWYAVVTERVGDAGLTNDVMGSAATMLSGLASDLEAERRVYNQLSGNLYSSSQPVLGGPEPYAVPVPDPSVQREMDACAARAARLLEDAAGKLLGYAALAGDIRAVPAANRTPGVADGANRRAASLQLLTVLFGSVVGNRAAGSKFEQAILRALGITKNTEIWRPDPAFEGRLTAGGLAKGTIVDGEGANFQLEIKGTKALEMRYQLRLQAFKAQEENIPWWIIKAAGQKADPDVVRAAEESGGGVLYTSDNGQTYTDGNGNQVQVDYDKSSNKIDVNGYKPSSSQMPGGDAGSVPSSDPGAPSEPVSPSAADAPPQAPDVPDIPEGPGEPEVPELPEFPEIIP